jgi:hypothetical protein
VSVEVSVGETVHDREIETVGVGVIDPDKDGVSVELVVGLAVHVRELVCVEVGEFVVDEVTLGDAVDVDEGDSEGVCVTVGVSVDEGDFVDVHV